MTNIWHQKDYMKDHTIEIVFENIMEVLREGVWDILLNFLGIGVVFFILAALAVFVFIIPFIWRKFLFGE